VKLSNAYISIGLLFSILFMMGFACKSGETSGPASANSPTNTTTVSSKAPSTDSGVATDVAGKYAVTGNNEGGGGHYSGNLVVTKHGEVYQFSWTSGGRSFDGVGVQTGNNVAVAFTNGNDGRGCGVVLYSIKSDGGLDGKAGYWGVNLSETETANRKSGTDLDGEYDITGSNPDGGNYTGTLSVKKNGAGYDFDWKAGEAIKGFGIRQGNTVSVGIGGNQCGFVGYEVKPDGTLEGKWGSPGTTSIGTETAKKQ